MGKLSKILSSFFYLTCIILFLSYVGLVYVNNSNDTIEPENISRPLVAQDSQKVKSEGQEVKKEYWDNGKLKSETHWKDGKPDGLSSDWYESGKNQIKTHYKNGERDGLVTTWWENGVKSGETHYKNGELEGLGTWWYESGKKKIKIHYKNGKEEGLETNWNRSGSKTVETYYKDGKRDGLGTIWYESGEKFSETHYKNGELEGLETRWFESGEKESKIHWKNGNQDGLETRWYRTGEKRFEVLWKNGQKDGLETSEVVEGEEPEEPEVKKVIKEIRSLFLKWQPIIKKAKENEFKNSKTLYHFAFNNFQNEEWMFTDMNTFGRVLIGTRIVVEDEIGHFINFEESSSSGDSFLQGEYYYNTKGELYFVFWKFNTYNGMNPEYFDLEGRIIPSDETDTNIPTLIPVTAETRLYFDHNGKIIRELESVYHINTKEKTNRGYAFSGNIRDRQVEHLAYHFDELPFYELLQKPVMDIQILAESTDSEAQYKLGLMYVKGKEIDQDYGLALEWFKLSAEQGNDIAQYELGIMYAEGMGVEKDDEESLKWFRLSAKEGNEDAVERLMALGLWDSDFPQDN